MAAMPQAPTRRAKIEAGGFFLLPACLRGEGGEHRRCEPVEHLCSKSSRFWGLRLPLAISSDERVGEHDELSG
ncbi:MAG TPA: hypothetical protein VGD13_05795, partial [Xanthobacteraceae bacterium]